MPRTQAVATLPINDVKVATAALRGRLQLTLDRDGLDPDWATLRIAGPRVHQDARGQQWFEWVATVEGRRAADRRAPGDVQASRRPTVADLGILRRDAG